MTERQINRIVILGGGTAGWITASALARFLGRTARIELIESDAIGTVGVGEATIPQIRRLNHMLGFDEDDFLRATKGTFKLGIEFVNWGAKGDRYLHTFGDVGINLAGLHFHQYWLRYRQAGGDEPLHRYSLHTEAAYANKFARMERVGDTAMGGLAYAFHFDAALYAQYLRAYAEGQGVVRHEGIVERIIRQPETGEIEALDLGGGSRVEGDLFIDCTGFRGLLIGEQLGVPYEDWSHWLPCDRAVAVPCEGGGELTPYTRATAHGAGWQWRIPLQHRVGNGHVFCSAYMSEDEATAILMGNLDGAPVAEPRVLRFKTGRRRAFWHKNCVAIGLASGFLEPLESTSIHLIQSNVNRLIQLFPRNGIKDADRDEYNRQVGIEFDQVKDFLILHYHLTKRNDTPFWNHVRTMAVPESLTHKMALFAASGRIGRAPDDLFRDTSWLQVMHGQGLMPDDHSPLADAITDAQLAEFLGNVRQIVAQATAGLPPHRDFIDRIASAAQ
jgi:tryptophan halogenase